jgi:tetratricopeptide (TPR) repeat protein
MKKYFCVALALVGCAETAGGDGPKAGPSSVAVVRNEPKPDYEAEARDPANIAARINVGVMKERNWDYEGALVDFEAAAAKDPKNTAAVLAQARVLVKMGRAEAADRLLVAARKTIGDKAELLNGLSSVARTRKRTADAIAYAKLVLLRDQANTDALNNIALAYLADNKLDAAELYTQAAIKRAADGALYVTLGLIQQRRGDAQRAMAFFTQAIDRDPNNGVAHANAGFLALQYRDYALAQVELDAAEKLGHTTKEVVAGKCFALEGLRKGPEAAACLTALSDKLAANDAELPSVLYALGMVHQNLTRDKDKALAAFKRYVDVRGAGLPKNDKVIELIRRLEGNKDDAPKAEVKPASHKVGKTKAGKRSA